MVPPGHGAKADPAYGRGVAERLGLSKDAAEQTIVRFRRSRLPQTS